MPGNRRPPKRNYRQARHYFSFILKIVTLMDSIKAQSKLVIYASWIITIILVLIPFHAFLTVWLASWLGHYTALRLWKEVLLLILLIKCLYLLAIDKNLRQNFLKSRII